LSYGEYISSKGPHRYLGVTTGCCQFPVAPFDGCALRQLCFGGCVLLHLLFDLLAVTNDELSNCTLLFFVLKTRVIN